MARSMWRGAISFGMVAIPVRMYLATEAHSAVSFRQLCPHCQLPIKQQRHCPTDDHVVAFNDVLKGYEVSKNQFVLIDEEDLDKLPLKTTRTIDIVEFVERNEVPLGLYIKSAYYLEPEEVGVKPFYLLKRALEDTNKVAVAKIALRDREHLSLIQVEGNTLLCNTLNWPDEIRSTEELNLPQNVKISDKEVKMATSLIDNLTDTFQPERYTDDYKAAFQQIVDQKMKGLKVVAPAAAQEPRVMDLMAALKHRWRAGSTLGPRPPRPHRPLSRSSGARRPGATGNDRRRRADRDRRRRPPRRCCARGASAGAASRNRRPRGRGAPGNVCRVRPALHAWQIAHEGTIVPSPAEGVSVDCLERTHLCGRTRGEGRPRLLRGGQRERAGRRGREALRQSLPGWSAPPGLAADRGRPTAGLCRRRLHSGVG